MKKATEKDAGFILAKVNHGPIYTNVFSTINKLSDNSPYNQYVVFSSNVERTETNKVPILHLNQSKFFYGNLFLFDFMSVLLTQNFPNIHKRFLYLDSVPWATSPQANFADLKRIFDSPNLEIIAGNSFVNSVCDICWKKPLFVAENFDYEAIKTVL